jgi:hypothetical protein
VDRWDKLTTEKAKNEPSFELVEDANGNLVLKEIPAAKPSVKKETTSGVSEREVSTGNGQKMIVLNKSETVLETLSKMEPAEVWDLSTVTKPRVETKLAQFRASQKAGIAREKTRSHELKLKEKPKIETKSKAAGRQKVEHKRKTTQAQRNAVKRRPAEHVEEITDATKLEKVKKDIKVMQLEKQEVVAKTVNVAKKKRAQIADSAQKPKPESVQKVSQKPKPESVQKVSQKQDAIPLPVIISIPRMASKGAVAPFEQSDAVSDIKSMNDAVEQTPMLRTPTDIKTDTKADTETDTKPSIKPRVKKHVKHTPKVKENGASKSIRVPRTKTVVPPTGKKKTPYVEDVPDISTRKAHRVIKNALGNMESFFGGSTTTKRKTSTKKRSTKRKSKTR